MSTQDVCDDSSGHEVDFVPLKPVREEEEERGGVGGSVKQEVEEEEEAVFEGMFEARLVVHQALHLPMVTDKTQ